MSIDDEVDTEFGELISDVFPLELTPNDLMVWSAMLDIAVTHGFELALVRRPGALAGDALLDQSAGTVQVVTDEVRRRWPGLGDVCDKDHYQVAEVRMFVLDRAGEFRALAYEMAQAWGEPA